MTTDVFPPASLLSELLFTTEQVGPEVFGHCWGFCEWSRNKKLGLYFITDWRETGSEQIVHVPVTSELLLRYETVHVNFLVGHSDHCAASL